MASGVTCVQRLDGSRDSAIHTKYCILLHSSSMQEPRYPLPRVVFVYRRSTGPPDARRGQGEALVQSFGEPRPRETPHLLNTFAGSFCCAGFDNDPSAANRPRRRDPNISPDHSIGRSDGWCVQRAGMLSTRADDSRLLGIPR
ncbi:hypothetical protein CQW23_34475 [Capsicum baccatum]|uniref:Uncharacterized protein n=1 Tax=Capsicum baccatum TaxID=33114 RepID=A0A2G2UYS3_CAPBA|nr:hypothetical protein CQW23_35729 [Capsicum baccatum]PHT25906.1 hypothetical protein CQW23_34475 [Capsicum baccatum]